MQETNPRDLPIVDVTFADDKRDERMVRDEKKAKAPTHIKGEDVRTLGGSIHDGTRSFQKRVLKSRAAARRAKKARRKQRSKR